MAGSGEAWKAVTAFCEVMLQKETAERIRRQEAASPPSAGVVAAAAATSGGDEGSEDEGEVPTLPPTPSTTPRARRSRRLTALAGGSDTRGDARLKFVGQCIPCGP